MTVVGCPQAPAVAGGLSFCPGLSHCAIQPRDPSTQAFRGPTGASEKEPESACILKGFLTPRESEYNAFWSHHTETWTFGLALS